MQQSMTPGWKHFNPEQEAQWAAEIYPALLREMAKRPAWATEVIAARAKLLGPQAAAQLRRDAARVWQRMRNAGEL